MISRTAQKYVTSRSSILLTSHEWQFSRELFALGERNGNAMPKATHSIDILSRCQLPQPNCQRSNERGGHDQCREKTSVFCLTGKSTETDKFCKTYPFR
jgi:hypothetical protein